MGDYFKLRSVDESFCQDCTRVARTAVEGLQKGDCRRPSQYTDPCGLPVHAGEYSVMLSPSPQLGFIKDLKA